MAAARTVFAQKGYNGARIDEIAARANVNKATIYYQIGDKDTLYTGALHQVIGHVARGIADAVSMKTHPEEKMKAYISFIAGAVEANPDLPPIMMREIASGGATLPRLI
ncbi:MAG TPA: helix-turn-helix domain-containing protein, partial [Smithella sp.]|nr:helix-turn-helix domain-containing protein [Smithella sp.]